MKIKPAIRSGFLQIRVLVALLLFVSAICLAKFSFSPPRTANSEQKRGDLDRPRYMPVPGGERGEASDLSRLEQEWNIRLTYPTGIFNPAWVRNAAVQDSLVRRATPAGIPFSRLSNKPNTASINPLSLSSSGFTSLGPQPEHMTGCTGCYDY